MTSIPGLRRSHRRTPSRSGRLKFLFTADGYPGVEGAGSGSGIGTYLADMTAGLIALGHECHVLCWGRSGAPSRQEVGDVRIHLVSRGYWPLVERVVPGSRDAAVRRAAARGLDTKYAFDWIEIQNDEGIDIGVQKQFASKTIVRVHTTLAQMVEYKKVPLTATTRAYLARESRSLARARRLIANTAGHAAEIARLFPLRVTPRVVPHGFDVRDCSAAEERGPVSEIPSFLVVGTLDRRKGSDRLRAVLDTYSRRFGRCRCVMVSSDGPTRRNEFGLADPPAGVEMLWRSGLRDEELHAEYRCASALLHLARYESFGYPPVEAAAFGTPVVATPAGAASELLAGDLVRFLIDGDEPQRVAESLAEAVKRPEVGATLQDRYRSRFTREKMVSSFMEALDSWTT